MYVVLHVHVLVSIWMLTVVEAGLKVRVGAVLHEHALGLLRVERDLWTLGADQLHKLPGVLVLLPVAGRQLVVGEGRVPHKARVLLLLLFLLRDGAV